MGSSFGKIFRLTTWGESHGPALGVVVEGTPAGIPLTEKTFSGNSIGGASGKARSLHHGARKIGWKSSRASSRIARQVPRFR